MTARTLITTGPTISSEDALRFVPHAEVHGPVEADQVLRWGLGPGDTLLIIDGLFLQSRAVRHKELLCLLDQGVRLYGASSMGALRAAELEAFGMQGIGRVFEDYRDGLLVGDDEVALTHGDADSGYQCASWALVDLRYAAQQAARAGVIDHEIAEAIVCVAKKLPFTLRDNFTILTQMREHGYHNAALVNFRVFCTLQRPSIKLTDAHAALRLVACATHPPKACAPHSPASSPSSHLRYRGRRVDLKVTTHLREWTATSPAHSIATDGAHRTGRPRDDEILNALALHWPGYPAFLRSTAAESLLLSAHPTFTPLPKQRSLLSRMAEVPDLTQPCLPWPPLADALSHRLAALGLPNCAAEAGEAINLLRQHERSLPWSTAGPLLATRMWRGDPRNDWRSPLIQRLALYSEHHQTAAITAGLLSSTFPPRSDDAAAVGQRCRSFLRNWGVGGPDDITPAITEHGFATLNEFVRAVRFDGGAAPLAPSESLENHDY